MIDVPLDTIKDKIKEETDLSEEEIDERISKKLEELSGLISEEGAAHIVASEMDINLLEKEGALKVDNLVSGMKNISLPVKVAKKYDLREFENDNGKGRLGKALIGDSSGLTMIVTWNDATEKFEAFEEGDVLMIEDGSVRENNGRVEVHISGPDGLTVKPKDVDVELPNDDSDFGDPERKEIINLEEDDQNVEIFATVVQVFDPKYFRLCPECRKKVGEEDGEYVCKQPTCDEDVVDPDLGSVMNLFADDGTDSMRVVLWKERILDMFDLDEEEFESFETDLSEFEHHKTELLGEMIRFVGNVKYNELFDRLELVANIIDRDVDPEEELQKLEEKEADEPDSTESDESDEDSEEDIELDDDEMDDEDEELLSMDELDDIEDI